MYFPRLSGTLLAPSFNLIVYCSIHFRFFVVLVTLSIASRWSLADEFGFSIKQTDNTVSVLVG